MTARSSQGITQLLVAWSDGDKLALEQLTPLVYQELRRMAQRYLSRERRVQTLQTTALINEAYLRLIDWKNVRWQNRAHFFAVASKLMRRIVVDYVRSRDSAKRGGSVLKIPLDIAGPISIEPRPDVVALDDSLRALEKIHPRQARVVEMRFFGGLSVTETAEVLKVAERTVARDWDMAQAWLYRELSKKCDS
jgi:RNA polymerase sigma factor (TIGR02999 family)